MLPYRFSVLLLLHFATSLAQTISPSSPSVAGVAPSPGPPGPVNVTAILEKSGQYTTLIRLLESTQAGNQIEGQLNNSNNGLTIFAPTDSAFSALKSGTLNSLTDEQKVELVQFHVLTSLFTNPQFQTASNPVRTQAGDSSYYKFPLNITTSGNQVNITTGLVNASVANTVYTGSNLAVYQVDKVLLPMALFGPQPPAQAPAPAPMAKKRSTLPAGGSSLSTDSSATGLFHDALNSLVVVITVMGAFALWL